MMKLTLKLKNLQKKKKNRSRKPSNCVPLMREAIVFDGNSSFIFTKFRKKKTSTYVGTNVYAALVNIWLYCVHWSFLET